MSDYLKIQNEQKAALLAQAFAAWERSLRGWQIWDYAVDIEPVFSTVKSPPAQIIVSQNDDARMPRGLQRLFGGHQIRNGRLNEHPQRLPAIIANDETKKPTAFYRSESLTELNILLPAGFETSPIICEQFFLSLGNLPTPVSFEILADFETINLQIACDNSLARHLKSQLQSFFNDIVISETQSVLQSYFSQDGQTAMADFGLARSVFSPLNQFRSFNPDMLTGLVSSLNNLQRGEKAIFQVLFQKAKAGWAEEVQRMFTDANLKSALSSQMSASREKFSSPLFAGIVRLAVESSSREQSWQILRRIGGNLSLFSTPNGNELIALSNGGLPVNNHLLSIISRTSYRSGMLLNATELASLAHLPSSSIKAEKLIRDAGNTKAAPGAELNHSLILGINGHQGLRRQVTLSATQRIKHAHLVGASGSGKSTLLLQMMVQDLAQNNGFACFDPHGDLIDGILERIPESRLSDVILFDPSDENYPIGFNILSAHSELEKTLLASDLVSIFRRFSTSWGDVIHSILANAVLAFLESSRGGNLIALKRFLIEHSFREEFLKSVTDEEIRYYWQVEFPQIKGKPCAPLLTRLDTFLRSKLIRHIVANKENKLDFRKIMDERKILLVRLSLGAIGQENAFLLGSLLVSKLYHATLSRQDTAAENRPPFFLYLDEAHHLTTESINQVLSGGRKYNLGLILAHQQLRQFQSGEADILASVLANCYTRICFRLDDGDAERLAKGFSFFTAEHLRNLGVGEAIMRLEQSRFDFNLKTLPLEPVSSEIAARRKNAVIEHTRQNYATPKARSEDENRQHKMNVTSNTITESAQNSLNQSSSEVFEVNQNSSEPQTSDIASPTNYGRGGAHHKELQSVIKRVAESYGFAVEIEKSVADGAGFIDVSLVKDSVRIAVEVSVTSSADYETKNVLKCLAAGYTCVFVVVSNQKKLPSLTERLRSAIPFEFRENVKAVSLTGLLGFLRELVFPKDAANKKSVKGGERLSFSEACEFFGIGASTLYRWIREGRVPFYRPGREYQFDRGELVLIGKQDNSAKRKPEINLSPLKLEKTVPKSKRVQDARYRKLLKMD